MTLERKTPLRADPAKVKAWRDRSRKRIPPRSKRRIEEAPERARVRQVVLDRDQGCMGRGILPGRCWHPRDEPLDVHEVLARGPGGDYLDPENCLALCRGHHQWVTTHPAEAEGLGYRRRFSGESLNLG